MRGQGSGLQHFRNLSLFVSFHLPSCSQLAMRRVLGPEFCLFLRKTLGILNLTLNTVSLCLNLPEVVPEFGRESQALLEEGKDRTRIERLAPATPPPPESPDSPVCLSLLGGLGHPPPSLSPQSQPVAEE